MGNILPPPKRPAPTDDGQGRYSKVEQQFSKEVEVPDASSYKQHQVKSEYNDTVSSVKEALSYGREGYQYKKNNYKWYNWVGEVFNCVNWIRTYKPLEYFVPDLLAGISIGFMVVPQAISYANLAGVAPQYGLYGSFLPVIVYAIFGSSRHLVVGPVAVTSNLISQMLVPLVPGQSDNTSGTQYTPNNPKYPEAQMKYDDLVTQLAFLVSVIYTLVGLLRLGWLVNFLSHATISGFMSGAALQILLQQIQYIAGYPTKQGQSYQVVGYIFKNIHQFKWQEFIMGMIFIAILVVFRELSNRYKAARPLKFLGPVTVFILGIMIVGIGTRIGTIKQTPNSSPLRLVGNVTKGPPKFTGRKVFPMYDFQLLLPAAIVVAAIDFTESNSIATALAVKGKYRLAYNKEILGLGLANFMGTLFNSYTTTGSFSRSAVNFGAGAKTQVSSVISAIIVLFVLLFLTPMFKFVPYNAIGAVIIVGVSNLIEPERAWYYFKVNIWDFFSWIGAFIVTFFLGVEYGLLTAVGIAALVVICQIIFPHMSEVGQVRNTNIYRPVTEYPENVQTIENILIYRVESPLNFANVSNIRNKLREILDRRAQRGEVVKYVVFDVSQTYRTDATTVHMFEEYKEELELYNIRFVLACPQRRVMEMMEAAHIPDHFGRRFIFATVHDAVNFCKLRLDFDRENPVEEADSEDSIQKAKKPKTPNWAHKFLPEKMFHKS